jgi:protein ImuA
MAGNATAQERLFALREEIARLEGRPVPALAAAKCASEVEELSKAWKGSHLSFAIPDLDAALEGGLPLDGITEIRSRIFRDAGASSGFALALAAALQRQAGAGQGPVLWISDVVSAQEAGLPYARGLLQFGLRPEAFLHATPRKLQEALWLAETAVASGALCATILEIRGNPVHFGLTESRRLALRAKTAGRPLFLLRHAAEEEASSAAFRFLTEPAPAGLRRLPDGSMLGGSIGRPTFHLTLEKSRNPAPLSFLLEWNSHDRQFSLAQRTAIPFPFGNEAAHRVARLSASSDRPHRPQEMGALLALNRAS